MAIYKRDIANINLETGNIHRTFLNHSIGMKDQKADHFGVRVFRDGEPVSLTGVSVQGVFMPPQGSPIAITSGNIVSGNVAEVVLPQACYNYDGQFTLAIKLVDSSNSVTGTVRIVDGMVDNTHASGTVAPTSAVPTYQEVLATYDQAIAAVNTVNTIASNMQIDITASAVSDSNNSYRDLGNRWMTFKRGYYSTPAVGSVSTYTEDSGYIFSIVSCLAGEIVHAHSYGGSSTIAAWAFLDSDMKVVSRGGSGDFNGTQTAPTGSVYVLLNVKLASIGSASYYGYVGNEATKDKISDLKSAITQTTLLEKVDDLKGYYINVTGSPVSRTPVQSSSGLSCCDIACAEGDAFTLYGTGASSGRLWCFIDSSNYAIKMSAENETASNFVLVTPPNAARLIVNYGNGGGLYKGTNDNIYLQSVKGITDIAYGKKEIKAMYEIISGGMVEYYESYNGDDYTDHLKETPGSNTYKVPCENLSYIGYRTFVSSSHLGSVFIDTNDRIINGYVETSTAGTRMEKVPENAKYFLLAVVSSTESGDYSITLYGEIKAIEGQISEKADKVESATSGNFAGLDASGNLTDSGKKASDFVETSAIENDLTGTTAGKVLDARQGKVLDDKVSDLEVAVSQLIQVGTIDISDYTVINGTIQSNGQWGGIQSSSNQSALITDIPLHISVTPISGQNAYLTFFKQVPTQPGDVDQQLYYCNGETGRHTVTSGNVGEFDVPSDCACIVVTIKANDTDRTPTITGITYSVLLKDIINTVDELLTIDSINVSSYDVINGTMQSNNVWGGYYNTDYQSALITDIPQYIEVTPPSSKKAYICFFTQVPTQPTDQNQPLYWCAGETGRHVIDAGDVGRFDVPSDCACIIAIVKSNGQDITPTIIGEFYGNALDALNDEVKAIANTAGNTLTPFADENRNMCLAGIKTDILTNKIPYHRGFLFHKLQNNDNSLWYGSDLEHIRKIGAVSFDPTLMRFAISPKDGRIIAAQRDTRNGIWIWDGETETHLESFETKPMAWLYNSGVDFINYGTTEYCIFAEYNGSPTEGMEFNVWRGTYPYTSVSDWEIVKTESYDDIIHFHQVRRDPWTNILYLTSGDTSAQSKWWYSEDFGDTWTLLVSGSDTGWGNSVCRTINFVFTKDYVYWATDHGENEHGLYKIARDSETGIIDLTTKTKLTDLPGLRATNSLCYVESPNGLFMYDRVDTSPQSEYGAPVTMKFWSFADEELVDVVTLGLTSETWGGSRGKCYVNYTNSKQPYPAMGFNIDTPCIFDLVCDNPSNIGTIVYEVGSKTIHTIDY